MYIIWTENKNTIEVIEKVTELFDGDNVVHGRGHYNGKGEESLRIEIFNDRRPQFNLRVYELARWIVRHNEQESVAVLRQDDPELVLPSDALEPSIVRNEFGIEQLDEPEGVYEKTPAKYGIDGGRTITVDGIPTLYINIAVEPRSGRYRMVPAHADDLARRIVALLNDKV